jgi:hypothetical protein
MQFDDGRLGLNGQMRVLGAWRSRLRGRAFIGRDELNLPAMMSELAHVSVMQQEPRGWRFRLAGTGLRQGFDREARGLLASEIGFCADQWAWKEALEQTLRDCTPVVGRTKTGHRLMHFWLRLPMSSDGVRADLILCHDRYLPMDALHDPERAARDDSRRLRLDILEPEAA